MLSIRRVVCQWRLAMQILKRKLKTRDLTSRDLFECANNWWLVVFFPGWKWYYIKCVCQSSDSDAAEVVAAADGTWLASSSTSLLLLLLLSTRGCRDSVWAPTEWLTARRNCRRCCKRCCRILTNRTWSVCRSVCLNSFALFDRAVLQCLNCEKLAEGVKLFDGRSPTKTVM